jgi:hypothetical protein
MDYAVPKASFLPHFETDRTVTPSPVNPLGVKGLAKPARLPVPRRRERRRRRTIASRSATHRHAAEARENLAYTPSIVHRGGSLK